MPDKVSPSQFAASVKEKYPEYKGYDDIKLTNAIIEKYPEYKDVVDFSIQPAIQQQAEQLVQPPLNKYQKAVNDDRSEIGKTLSTIYNGIVGSLERLAGGGAELFMRAASTIPTPQYNVSGGYMPQTKKPVGVAELPKEQQVEARKQLRGKVEKTFQPLKSTYTTQEEEKAMQGKFDVSDIVTNGIGLDDLQGLVAMSGGMAADMALGAATGGATFVIQGYDDAVKDYDEAAQKMGVPENENARMLYGIAGGTINGLLEKFAIDKLVGDGPVFRSIQKKAIANVLKNTANVTGKKAVDAIEEAAEAEVRRLTSDIRSRGMRIGYRTMVEGGTEAVQAALEDGAKFAINNVQGNEVFNEKEIKDGFFKNVINSGVAGGIYGPVMGYGADKVFGRNVNTQLLKDIADAKTDEDLASINDELSVAFDENNFSEAERQMVLDNAKRYNQIKQTLPAGTPAYAQIIAIPLIENRIKIDDEINKRKQDLEKIDESLRPDEQSSISLLEDRRAQINDDIKEVVTGQQFTFFEKEGKYFKQLGENAPEEISKNRYDLQTLKQEENATKTGQGPIQKGATEGDISQRQGTEGQQDQEVDESNLGYSYIVSEEGEEVPVAALVNKKVRVNGKPAILYREGQRIVARVIGTNQILDTFGNVVEMMNAAPSDFGIEVDETIVTETPTGYRVAGEEMVNDNANPLDAISRDQNGKVMNVTLKTPSGRRRKFRGQAAQDLAYQITLKEILKNEEEFESFLEQQHQEELDAAEAKAASETEATRPNEPVPSEQKPAGPTITTTPAIGRFTVDDINDIDRVNGNRVQKKVITDVKRIVTALRSLTPVSVNLHNQETFTDAVVEAGGTQEDSVSRGFYMDTDGSIHLNMDMLASDTMLHEGFHPLLDFLEKNNPEVINDIFSQLESIPEAKSIIDNARQLYSGDITQKKEAITDFVAGVADGRVVLNPTNFQKIKAFVINTLNKIGIGQGQTLMNVNSEQDLMKLAEFVTEKFTTGKEISSNDILSLISGSKQYDTSDGVDIEVDLPSTGSDRKPQFSKKTIEAAKNNLKSLAQLAGTKISRVVFYDLTRVGKLSIKNIKSGYTPNIEGKGGPLYSYMPSSIKEKSVLAFVSINQAIQSLQRQILYPEGVHAIASQNPQTAHLGNKSTLTALFGDGIGIFQNAAKTKAQESEIVRTLVSEIDRISKMPGGEATKSVKKILKTIDLQSIKTINDFRDKILLGKGDSFGSRGSILNAILQNKQTKITAATRDSHKLLHYKYGIPTIADIAEGNNQQELSSAELGDVIKLVKPSVEPVVYTTSREEFEKYSNKPTKQMKKAGITIKFIENVDAHESYPFILAGENVALLDNFISAAQMFERFSNLPKSKSFFSVGRMKKFAEAGEIPESVMKEVGRPKFQKVAATDIVNGFYSPIEDRINSFKQPKASVNKWKEIIGIKSDEAVFSGMADYLNELKPDQQLSKDDVLKFIKDNRIKINTVSRGGDYIVYNPKTGDDIAYFNSSYDAYAFQSEAADEGYNYEVNEPSQSLKTKYEEYQLPGGNNYQEVLITLPGKDQFKSSHFDETNIITHLRMNTRTDSSGKKVLFLEEVQSDWGQIGRDKGFTRKINDSEIKKINEINSRQNAILNSLKSYRLLDSFIGDILRSNYKPEVGKLKIDPVYDLLDAMEGYISGRIDNPYYDANDPAEVKRNRDIIVDGIKKQIGYINKFEDNKYSLSDKQINDIIDAYNEDSKNGRIKKQKGYDTNRMVLKAFDEVDNLSIKAFNIFNDATKQLTAPAPYVTNTNAWVKLGLKFAIKEAINQGADKIAWITGEQQSERYDLRNQLDEIFYFKKSNDTYNITAYKDNRILFQEDSITPNTIANYFGKDIANRIINGEGVKPKKTAQGFTFNRGTKLEGDDLAFEGKGMKAFYGNANNPGIVANVAKALVKELTGGKGDIITSKIEIDGKLNEQPAIDITTDLKQSVKGGMPQFQKINWEKSKDGKGDPSISSRNPIVVYAAKKLKEGKITNEEYRATVSQNSPISPITKFFEPATEQQINNALSKDKIEKINAPISDGDTVGLRLDIPAYSNNNTWVVSVHDGDTNAGKAISYRNVARITDVRFGVEPKAALSIAAGIPKTTIGRMFGKWSNVEGSTMNEQGINAKELIQSIVDDPNYVQVGMNPFRHSYFYDRSSDIGRPIVSADEVIQIGGLVYAKNPVYGKWTDEAYRVKGLFDASGIPVQFQKAPTEAVSKKKLGTVRKKFKEQFRFGLLGKEEVKLREKMTGELSAELDKAERFVKASMATIKKYGKSVSEQDVVNFMTGKPVAGNMPLDLAADLTAMREHIDGLTERLIQLGVIDNPESIAHYQANKGQYLLRSYEAINYKDNLLYKNLYGEGLNVDNVAKKLTNVDKTVVDAALKYLADAAKAKDPTMSDADAMKQARIDANEILSTSETYVMQKGLTGSTNIKSLSQRKDIAPEIRALMGEYTDPLYNYYSTIFKISSLTSSRQYINSLKDYGLNKFLFEKPTEDATEQIAAEGTKTLAPLNGLYTFPEIKEALQQSEKERGNYILSILGRIRKFKTVYNPATHIKNIIGNMGFAISNGHWNYMGEAYKYIRAEITNNNDADAIKMMDTLNRYGVLNNAIGIGELKNYFKEHESVDNFLQAIYNNANKNTVAAKVGRAKAKLDAIPKAIEKAYAIEDDVFKILGFVNESNRYANALYGKRYNKLSGDQKKKIDEIASEIVKDTYPTFSRVPKIVKTVSRGMFLGNFLAFPVESVRVQYNSLALAKKEINSGNPKLRTIGITRLAGALIYNSLFSTMVSYGYNLAGAGLTGMIGMISGDDEEEKETSKAIVRNLAPWNKNFNEVYVSQFNNGKLVYYDIGSLDSYNYQKRVWNAFWSTSNKDGFSNAIWPTIATALDPWMTKDFVLENLIKLDNNDSGNGFKIYNPEAKPMDRYIDMAKFAGKQFLPGFIGTAIKTTEAYQKGDYEKMKDEFYSQVFARKYTVDLKKQFTNYIYAEGGTPDKEVGFKSRLENATRIYTDAKRSGLKGIELSDKYRESIDAYKEILGTANEYYSSAVRGGVNPTDLIVALKKSRIGVAETMAIVTGNLEQIEAAYIRR